MTDEEFRENAKELSDFAFSMAKGNREAFVLENKIRKARFGARFGVRSTH